MSAKQAKERSFWSRKVAVRNVPKKYNSAGNKHGRFSVSMPFEVIEAARKYCAESGEKLSSFVCRAIKNELQND